MQIPVQALIFDLDGVIADTDEYHYQSWKQLADEENIDFTRADSHLLRGVTRRESLRRILKGQSIDESTAQDWMGRKNDYFHELLDQLKPEHSLPGIRETIAAAKAAGMKLGVGSASKNAEVVLRRLELRDQFDVVGDGNIITNTKPAPDVFLWVAGGLGVAPRHVVVFEDSGSGVAAARAAGMGVVGLGSADVHDAHVVLPDLGGVDLHELLTQVDEVRHRSNSAVSV